MSFVLYNYSICSVYIHLVILFNIFNIFKLHSRFSCNYAYERTTIYRSTTTWYDLIDLVYLQFMDGYVAWRLHPDISCQLLCQCRYQHCDEPQFQILSCAVYTIFFFSVIKLDLVIQALLLGYIIALGKHMRTPCVHLVVI